MEIINWLNANDGAVIGVVTLTLMGITAYYAYLTGRLLKATDTPEIVISLRPHEISVNLVMLCIENVGTGVARNVKFTTDPSVVPSLDIPFENIGFLKSGIGYFEPRRKIEQFLVSVIGKFDELKQAQLKITVTYEDSANRKYERIFPLDFSEGVGFSQIGSPPLYEIAKAAKEIQKDLHNIATGSRKPIVLTEPLSEYRLEKHVNSLENRMRQFSSEIQQEILQEVDVIVNKREHEVWEKEQNDKTTKNVDSS